MSRRVRFHHLLSAASIAAVVSACSEPAVIAGPSLRPMSIDPRSALLDPGAPGLIVVCSSGGAATFSVSASPATGTLLGGGTFSVADGSCVNAWTAVDVTSTTITVTQTGGLFSSVEATATPTSGLPFMTVDQSTKTVTWSANSGHGGSATFFQAHQPEDPPHEDPPEDPPHEDPPEDPPHEDPPEDPPHEDPPHVFEGCTPGYWKQSQHFGNWTAPYVPTGSGATDFDAAFGVNAFNPNITLLTALGLSGGGLNALARHAAAALLNAASGGVDYNLTTAQVIAAVQAAIASGDYETAKNMLAGFNELGCGLERAELQ